MSNSRTTVVMGPLAAHAAEVDKRLAELGYSRATRKEVQLAAAALSEWLQEIGLAPAKLTDELVARLCEDCSARKITCPSRGAERLVTMLRAAGVVPPAVSAHAVTKRDVLVDGFVDFLREERGLAPLSVEAYRSDVLRFLQHSERDDLRGLAPIEINKAVLREVLDHSPNSVRRFGVALRSFLRYAYVAGLIDIDLSASALPVSGRRRSLLPNGLTAGEAARMLRSCDRRQPEGRRDYAAMLLMMRLGMRAREVATLTLDDIDWRAGVVTVHGKGSELDRLPLPVDVGEAITAYLRRGRPPTPSREVFIRSFPPRVALTRAGISGLVLAASHRARLGHDVRAHQLRHTAASDMLRAGVTPAQIGEVLRHRSAGSTAIYARVDVDRLRLVARRWPIGRTS
jgi:site-specific recombinase XerD